MKTKEEIMIKVDVLMLEAKDYQEEKELDQAIGCLREARGLMWVLQ